jgi:4-alpha-glucanotransferase
VTDRALRRLAAAHGIALAYRADGRTVEAAPDALRAVLTAIGVDLAAPAASVRPVRWPAVLVVASGAAVPFPRAGALVVLESGEEVALPATLPGPLPIGYHRIVGRDGETALVVAPERCYLPPHLETGRDWGFSVQLYALRSRRSWGLGDLGDLAAFGALPAAPDFVLLNPLHAALPTTRQENSPYSPSSRRYRNPLYVAVEDVPEVRAMAGEDRVAVARAAAAGRALTASARIDRDAVFALKDGALRRAFRHVGAVPERAAALAAFRAADPALEAFATFSAIAEARQEGWQRWPAALRDPASEAVVAYAAAHAETVAYHAWLQLLLDEQLAAAACGRLGVITDLAVGVSPHGYDAWARQDVFASGLSVGAPPDALGLAGQSWGLPPMLPSRLRERGYRDVSAVLRANMRHAGGLRIDHAIGFFRLFVIPEGGRPADGVYLRYPADDLLGILALESARARCLVVGEALGTLEPGMLEALSDRGVLAYRLALSERGPAQRFPRRAMAAVTTHDMPTLAGVLGGTNLPYLRSIGALSEEDAARLAADEARVRRLVRGRSRRARPPIADPVRGAYAFLADTPSMLACVSLDDALGAVERPNVPGTVDEHPNWRVPLPVLVEDIPDLPLFRDVTALLAVDVL